MAVADRNGLPVSVYVESATPHEVTLAMSTLLHLVVPDAAQNLVADNAYDSDRERLFAWLQNFRRLVVRYERHAENFLGMLHLASSLILLRHL